MSILDELRLEATTLANASQLEVLARVLSIQATRYKDVICKTVGKTHESYDESSYSRLVAKRLQVKMAIRLAAHQPEVCACQVERLEAEFERLMVACEAAKRNLFYQEE